MAYLLGLERVVGCLDGHILLAVDLDTVGDDALDLALVGKGIGDDFALGVGDLVMGLAWDAVSSSSLGRLQDGVNFCVSMWTRVRMGSQRTVKPSDEAQMALPAASQMTALSMLPGPTRLRGNQKTWVKGKVAKLPLVDVCCSSC